MNFNVGLPTTFIITKTFGIDLTNLENRIQRVIMTVYDVENDTYTTYESYLEADLYDTTDELIFDFENGKIYVGEEELNNTTFYDHYKNITGIYILA